MLDNADPQAANRLNVTGPEVLGDSPAWATPAASVSTVTVPEVGSEVWVEFHGGSPDRPVWTGAA